MCMFFKLYVVLTFFSLAGLLMWYKARELKTNKKLREFEKSIQKYKRDGKEKEERKTGEGTDTGRPT